MTLAAKGRFGSIFLALATAIAGQKRPLWNRAATPKAALRGGAFT